MVKMGLESQVSPETATKKSKKKIKREKDKSMVPVQNEQPQTSKEESVEQQQRPLDVQIELINSHTDKTTPIVGYFPSGFKFCKNDAGSGLEELGHQDNLAPSPMHPDIRFYRNAQRTKIEKSDKWRSSERMELVVAPTGPNVEFVGRSYKGEAVAAQLCTYALGVLDKKSQTLKIMPIAGNKIFRLEPKIRGLDTSEKEPAVVENSEATHVTHSYMTKKSINTLKNQKKLEMVVDPKLQGDLSKTIDSIVISKEALENVNIANVRNIPPHNISATTPQEAYPLDRIIMKGEWDRLEDVSRILELEAGVAAGAYPTFVLHRIYKLRDIKNEEEKQTISRIFSFITHLIKFKDMHSIHGRSSVKNRIPDILEQRFARLFDLSASRRLQDDQVNLLISYVLVLTLYADNFRTDSTDIAKDLKYSRVVLSKHFMNLGCKRDRENKVLFTLPTPLIFPAERRKRRR